MKKKGTAKTFDRNVFGKRLEPLRKKAGYTQEEMATAIHRTRVAYFNIENGSTSPSADCIMDIINALSKRKVYTSLDYLFGRTDHESLSDQINAMGKENEALKRENARLAEVNELQKKLIKATEK